jgi:hypothetical protein
MRGKPYGLGTDASERLFSDIDIPGYVDTFYRAYAALGDKLPAESRLRETGKKWLDSKLLTAFMQGMSGLPAESFYYNTGFSVTDTERIILEKAVGDEYIDNLTLKAQDLGKACCSMPGLAPKVFETVCAGVVEKFGKNPEKYRKTLRDPSSPYSSVQLRTALNNTDQEIN